MGAWSGWETVPALPRGFELSTEPSICSWANARCRLRDRPATSIRMHCAISRLAYRQHGSVWSGPTTAHAGMWTSRRNPRAAAAGGPFAHTCSSHVTLSHIKLSFPPCLRQRGGGARASTRADDGEAGEGRGPSVPVEEAEGLRLHLSRCSNTGYRGVTRCWHSAGRFRACRGDKCSRKDLGYFDTAVDAAVAVARSFAAEAAEKAEAEEEEGDHGGPSSSAARSRASRRREAPVCSYCSKSGSAQMRLHRCNNSHRCDGLLHPLCMERYLRVADLDDDVCLCKQCAEELQEDSD